MSLENARFDGLDLAGRFLVGVVDGQLRLDKRIVAMFGPRGKQGRILISEWHRR
jgi:hypothetical protein